MADYAQHTSLVRTRDLPIPQPARPQSSTPVLSRFRQVALSSRRARSPGGNAQDRASPRSRTRRTRRAPASGMAPRLRLGAEQLPQNSQAMDRGLPTLCSPARCLVRLCNRSFALHMIDSARQVIFTGDARINRPLAPWRTSQEDREPPTTPYLARSCPNALSQFSRW